MSGEFGQFGNTSDVIGATLSAEHSADAARVVTDAEILDAAQRIAETVLGPNAHASDVADGPNIANFMALAEAGLLGLTLPKEFGGLNASGDMQRKYTQILASYCGVTAFIQAQHHGPSRMIANGPNEALKQALLPDLASGKAMCAISFAHLRRPGPPTLAADPTPGGYRLNGTAPYVTGWGLMKQVVFGATLPEGRFVYLWSPADRRDFPEIFKDAAPENGDWGAMVASLPLKLCAMNASATVELSCRSWLIPEAHLLSETDRETMRRNDRNGVLGATAMPLGCAEASLRVLDETASNRPIAAIRRTAACLRNEWNDLAAQIEERNRQAGQSGFFEEAIKLRSWSIELAVRAAHAAVTSSSGAANLLTHPAQRLLREAMFYTIQAQTQEVMDATLSRLERV